MTRPSRFDRPFALGLLLFGASLGTAQTTSRAAYILQVSPGTQITALAPKYGLTVQNSWTSDKYWSYSVTAPQLLPPAVVTRLRAEHGVLQLETNSIVRAAETETDSRVKPSIQALGSWFPFAKTVNYYGSKVHSGYVQQPMTEIIELDQAQKKFGAGSGIVAIIDTGVDPTHPALRNVLLPGYDFTRNRSDTVSEFYDLQPDIAAYLQQSTVEILDGGPKVVLQVNSSTVAILNQSTVEILDGNGLPNAFGHGTMVAGLVHLVAPEARIMPLKAFHADGSAQLSDIVRAIHFAVDHGANVINMSFSFAALSAELQSAVEYASSRGVLCVASSGNAGKSALVYPAALPMVIGVGSTNYSDRRSPFSNFGRAARTSAPGEALVTPFPGNTYAGVWGTSFSSALVSGALALFKQAAPHLHMDDVDDTLDYGARIDEGMGDARLDLFRSLTYLVRK